MAAPFKIHSLKKIMEETMKPQKNESPEKKPKIAELAPAKKVAFAHNDSDSDDSSSSSSSGGSDSDSDDSLDALVSSKKRPIASKPRHTRDEIPDSDDESALQRKDSKSAKGSATITKAKAPSPSIDERLEASSDDSDEEEQPTVKPTVKPSADGKSKASSAKEDSREEDSESETSEQSESETSEQSEEAASEQSEEDASEQSADDASGQSETESSDKSEAVQVAPSRLIIPSFKLNKYNAQSDKRIARDCREAKLQGKQIWCFALPTDTPLAVVEDIEFPVDASRQLDGISRHAGNENQYGISFSSAPSATSIRIMIPPSKASSSQPYRGTSEQVIRYRRITELNSTTDSSKAIESTPAASLKKATPATPNGSQKKDASVSDSTPKASRKEDAPATEPTPQASQTKKLKDASDPNSATKNKKSKRKHSHLEDEDAAAATAAAKQLIKEGVASAKKQKTGRRASPDLTSQRPGSALPATPTPAKKAKLGKSLTNAATPARSSQDAGSAKRETPVPLPVIPASLKTPPGASPKTKADRIKKKKHSKMTDSPA